MITHHASAERAEAEIVQQAYRELGKIGHLDSLMEALPYVVTILNRERQIVFSNNVLLEHMGIADIREFLGKRPGESLHCIHSQEMRAGCGTSKFCQVCGAVNTIIRCQETGRQERGECRLRTIQNGSEKCLDLEVTAAPFLWNDSPYIIFTARDISHEKRKEALERIFFHDVINTAETLQSVVEILKQTRDPGKIPRFIDLLSDVSRELTDEILNQKSLLAAENGELEVKNYTFYLHETIGAVVKDFLRQDLALDKKIQFPEEACEETLITDPVLLRRVLSNMIRNALEAIQEKEEIRIDCRKDPGGVIICVRNPGHIPENVRKQIFQRSFSTKGKGRGLGTYSMKLLAEKYLKGKVWFTSSEREGTIFYLRLPVSGNRDQGRSRLG